MPARGPVRLAELTAAELRPRLDEALQIYVTAMRYPPGTARHRRPMWREHMLRGGWRCVAAFDAGAGASAGATAGATASAIAGAAANGGAHAAAAATAEPMVGIAYGYLGASGQWWHDEVQRGLKLVDPDSVQLCLTDYFELTELHVHPDAQGRGIGRALLTELLSRTTAPRVLLSTPEGPTRAWQLYRRFGFTDLLRNYRFTGDSRPFAVLCRSLPL